LLGVKFKRTASAAGLQEKNPSSLLEDLKKYQDDFSDFATIRIYWKFYTDKKMTKEVNGGRKTDPRRLERGYYLYINRTKQIYELDRYDIKSVIQFCSD